MLRLAVSRIRVPRATTRLRGYSTAPGPEKDSPAVIALTFGFLVAGAGGFYFVSHGGANQLPVVRDEIDTSSPVVIQDLKTANAQIRQEASSFAFDSRTGKGRIDLVRVASNHPVEDRWDVAVGKGLGGNKTLFAGVYDGHA